MLEKLNVFSYIKFCLIILEVIKNGKEIKKAPEETVKESKG